MKIDTKKEPDKQARKIYDEFKNGEAFKNAIDLDKAINRSVMFENGFQWKMDQDIEEFRKITLNIIKQIKQVHQSNILQNEYSYLVNSTNFESIRKIQDFLKFLSMKLRLRILDLKALNDDFTKGTAIMYFFWDTQKRGFMSRSGGDLRAEIIDIRNLVVANPYCTTIQDQEWIIYARREKISALKKHYGEDKDIVPDGDFYTGGTEKQPISLNYDDEYVNVYTKFYRNEDGQVLFVTATETTVLKPPTPMQPFYVPKSTEEMPSTLGLPDELVEELKTDKRGDYIWNLYPFARLCLNERDNCFYGTPIALEYVEAQKSINNHFAIYDKALQDNVLGGYVYRKDALDSQEITAENGQMIALDLRPGETISQAFGRIPAAEVPTGSHQYSITLAEVLRGVAGASNIQLGRADFSGQSGRQTQLLLQRARENASARMMLFNDYKVQQAYIMFLFAKFYYKNENFAIIEHGVEEDSGRKYEGDNAFTGEDYLDDDVIIDIQVGSAPSFSEYTNIEILGQMVQSGQLPFEVYLRLLPPNLISNRQEIMKVIENNFTKEINALKLVIEQQRQVMEQMAKTYEQTKKDISNIDTIVQENERLKSMIAEVAAKAVQKVSESSQQSAELTMDMQNLLKILNK